MSNENKPIANSIKEQTYYKGKTAEVRKWAFASGELVYNLPWMLISSFLAFFMTDIALIPAQTVAILFLVCRIWDAVNDPMIGSMADRTKSKMGRYRPWMLGGAVCLMPIVVLLFTAHPSWSVGARTTYACVLYALAVIAATAWNIPFSALNGVISPYPNERASFSSHRIFVSSIACAATNAMFLPLVNRFSEQGGKTQGYSMAALTICLLTVPFIFTSILGTKEVVKAPPSQKMGTKQVLGNFFKNPPLLIVCTAFLVYGFLNYGRMTAGMYYFTYFWGDTGLFSIYAPINGIICAVSAFFSGYIIKLQRQKRCVAVLLRHKFCPEQYFIFLKSVKLISFGCHCFAFLCRCHEWILYINSVRNDRRYGRVWSVENRCKSGRTEFFGYKFYDETRRSYCPDNVAFAVGSEWLCSRRSDSDRRSVERYQYHNEFNSCRSCSFEFCDFLFL